MPIYQPLKLAIAGALLTFASTQVAFAESVVAKTEAPKNELTSQFIYKYLIAEIAGQRGDLFLSSNLFLDLAKSSQDPRLAERAAKAAAFGNINKTAAQAVTLWAELDPASVEAQQANTQVLISTGRIAEAKPFLEKLLQKEDTRANGFLYLNTLFARYPDKKAVLDLVQELAKPYPKLPEAHFTIANAAWGTGNIDLALSELAIAEKLRPDWEVAAIIHGQILYGQSPKSAIIFYQNYLEKHQEANEVRLTMARMMISEKRFSEAKPEFVKLVKLSKSNPEVMVVVGLLSFQGSDYVEAEKYFQQALNSGFKDPDQIYLYLGQIAEKQNHDEQAIAWYSKVNPGNRYFEAKLNASTIIARTQGVDAAVKQLSEMQGLDSEQQALVIQTQANLFSQAKRYQEAYDFLDRAVTTLPNTPEIVYDYAMAAERIERIDVTEKELRKLIQLKPDFAQAYNALGYTLADRNIKLDEAQQLIEKALSLSPNDHYILDSMGWVQYRMGKLDKAEAYLRQAYVAQTDPEIAAHLGEVLWQRGNREEAQKTWNDALREHPENEVLLNTTKKFQ
ncbi:MAG: tetratricopeptide repeat protein [Methylophilaceae bacterium]